MKLLPVIALTLLVACNGVPPEGDYVARVGSETLTEPELADILQGLSVGMDSADAAAQVIEQWVARELLFAESTRRGLDRSPEVRAGVLEAERAVLVNALVEQVYNDADAEPTEAELQAYFERSRERMRLLEPYVRIRYLVSDSLARARELRTRLASVDTSDLATWATLTEELSTESDRVLARSLEASLVPETRVFAEYPALSTALASLRPGQTGSVVPEAGRFHVVQLVGRVPAGTLPERAWIEEALRQQMRIESRKLLYERLVQRLRNEALAREQLDLPASGRDPGGSQ